MKQIQFETDLNTKDCPIVATVGAFDGVHTGHCQILGQLVADAKKLNGQSLVITFSPHPLEIVRPEIAPPLLTDDSEKQQLLANLGIDWVYFLRFDRAMADLTPEQFVEKILVQRFSVVKIIIGYDHGFGRNRSGHADELKQFGQKFGFDLAVISPMQTGDHTVSSSKIRAMLTEGSLGLANQMLGWSYQLSGTVCEGNRLGRTLGFPTANIRLTQPRKLIPKKGVYIVRARVADQQHFGVMNIGVRPTLAPGELSLEVHLFEFSDTIYDQPIQVELLHYLRDERKFADKDELIRQIEADSLNARNWLTTLKN